MNNKQAAKNKIKNHNLTMMKVILGKIITKMTIQGRGCVVQGYGVSYVNKRENTRDPIAHLLPDNSFWSDFNPIDHEAMKPVLNKIMKKYSINITFDTERRKFRDFLSSIQEAHDEIFEIFPQKSFEHLPIDMFLSRCASINKELVL